MAADGCRPYGAAALMRVPGRLRIAWENDTTMKIDTDAGQQTRLLQFDNHPSRGRDVAGAHGCRLGADCPTRGSGREPSAGAPALAP